MHQRPVQPVAGLPCAPRGEVRPGALDDVHPCEPRRPCQAAGVTELAPGVYESVRTRRLLEQLAALSDVEPRFEAVGEQEAPGVLARHVAQAVEDVLTHRKDASERLRVVNQLLLTLESEQESVDDGLQQLVTLTRRVAPGVFALTRPLTPLGTSALLTNAAGEPSLQSELAAELASADEVSLLCAFIRWHGLRVLKEPLTVLRDRGVPLRVITTTYLGGTEQRAVDELARRFGAEVKVHYETASTRLHAKAWLFRRNSGFDTAFVGSSNLSRSALVDGLEWNVRLSGTQTPELVRKFAATFDTHWADPAFVGYDPDRDGERLAAALAAGGRGVARRDQITLSGLQLDARPHQRLILEALDSERLVHDRHRNLVVAATGTGKTVVAALDYRALRERAGRDLSLLFVAHRQEILDQARRTYQEALSDASFGERLVGGDVPRTWRHVFASVQSLAGRGVGTIDPGQFDVIVIDEFHHAEAATYRRVLDHFRPQELLGLTATPERSDGVDVRSFFDGRTAYEMRIWDALADDLLVPFHYFGVADDVDLTTVTWKRGTGYDVGELTRVYTGNDARTAKVLAALRDIVTDVGRMRAIGFCVSVEHARYMAERFTAAGVPSVAVSARTSDAERADALRRLRDRTVSCLFAVDLFNEGVDVPEVDTLLMLRPTESATLFLQQLGRGLRRAPDKAVLTVLDLIGQHRREFRFDARYRGLTGATRRGLQHQVEHGFPFLPSGSQIILDRVSRTIVLENLRQQVTLSRRRLVDDVRSHGDLDLAGYLHESGTELADVYRSGGSWTALRREAGLPTLPAGPAEADLLRRMAAFAHVDDPERARTYARLAGAGPDGAPTTAYDELSDREQQLALMLFFTMWPDGGGLDSYDQGLRQLREHPAVGDELSRLTALSVDRARALPVPLGPALEDVPLFSHARYRRDEILAAIGWASLERKTRGHVKGVEWSPARQVDVLLVNLHKSEKDFSPTTMYRDYAISPDLFHWESQNMTTVGSSTGRRYLQHHETGSHVILFTRDRQKDEVGSAPFVCLGDVDYVSHRGERPIAITWQLRRPMPATVYRSACVAAG